MDALRRELAALQETVCNRSSLSCRNPEGDSLLGVFRLFPEMSPEDFVKLAASPDLATWLTLPLDRNDYPQLSRLQRTLEELAFRADHDALTGLPNRRALERALDMEMERSRRDKTALSLAMLDIDDFKKVNDTYGHPTGDKVLVALAGILYRQHPALRRGRTHGRRGVRPGLPGHRPGQVLTAPGAAPEPSGPPCSRPRTAAPSRSPARPGLAGYRGSPEPVRVGNSFPRPTRPCTRPRPRARTASSRRPRSVPAHDLKRTLVKADEKRFLFTGQPSDKEST